MRNIAIALRYDGSAYHGWQVQKNAVTVAETLECALTLVCKHPVKVVGCGRTDAGVHANIYCANFKTTARIPTDRIALAVNARLPMDIAVLSAIEAPLEFNAISCCIKKEYAYHILNSQIRDPFDNKRVCFYPAKLDVAQMAMAAKAFEGTHDFAAVRSVGTETKTTVRTIYWCRVTQSGDRITLFVCANGFLYNMARAIAGTCVYAGHGKIQPDDIPALLATRDRRLTGPTMPPQGLYLNRLWYPAPVNTLFDTKDTTEECIPFSI